MAAVVESGLGGLVLETAAAVRQYDLQRPQDQVVATDAVVVPVPGCHEAASQVSFVYTSRPDLHTVEGQTIAGSTETVPGQYRGTELI